jgi:hypothetical protein
MFMIYQNQNSNWKFYGSQHHNDRFKVTNNMKQNDESEIVKVEVWSNEIL